MKSVIIIVLTFVGITMAQENGATHKGRMVQPLTPEIQKKIYEKTGGLLCKPVQGPSILFLDLQKSVEKGAIQGVASDLGKVLMFPFRTEQAEGSDVFKAVNERLADGKVASVVAVIDQKDFANVLVAPENRWAIVNVAPLRTKGVDAAVLGERVRKELLRALGLMMGAGNTAHPQCPLKAVLNPDDLDQIKGRYLSPGPMNNMVEYGKKIGLQQSRPVTYRKACEEGWAPAPTNDIQKAIWDEVKKQKK